MTDPLDRKKTEVRNLCPFCNKPMSRQSLGSLSGWIFDFNRCRCGTGHLRDNVSDDPLAVEEIADMLPDRYELLKVRGSGGMGWLLKVHDRELGIDCALKLMKSDLVKSPLAKRRFEIESATAAKLDHPNLVSVIDHGITANGAPFIAMRYESGLSLAEIMEQETYIRVERALPIFMQICEGMLYSHGKGVIHRDLKPGNIIVNNFHGEPTIKIVDFGIAFDSISGADMETITMTGEVVGSPQYMSPEQCRGEVVDHRTDIYSLGCVMYELLTGHSPFASPNPVKTILKQLNQRPSRFRSKFAFLNIPGAMERIVFHCLEKKPASRYQYMEELLRDLHSVASGTGPRIALIQKEKNKAKKVSPLQIRILLLLWSLVTASYITYLSQYDTLTLLFRLFNTGLWSFFFLVSLLVLVRLILIQKDLLYSHRHGISTEQGDGWLFLLSLTFTFELCGFLLHSLSSIVRINQVFAESTMNSQLYSLPGAFFTGFETNWFPIAAAFVALQFFLFSIWLFRRRCLTGKRAEIQSTSGTTFW